MPIATSCGKAGYNSQREAEKLIKRFRTSKKKMRPYYCKNCHFWHITTQIYE